MAVTEGSGVRQERPVHGKVCLLVCVASHVFPRVVRVLAPLTSSLACRSLSIASRPSVDTYREGFRV